MTQPRIVRAEVEPVYQGRFAVTRLEDHHVTSPAGSSFVAPLYHVVDADNDAPLLARLGEGSLNRAVCPSTGEVVTLDIPVLVHSHKHRLLVLVVPESRRHEQIQLRIDLLRELSLEPDAIPAYILDFETAFSPFGPSELKAKVERRRLLNRLEAERQRLAHVAARQELERLRLEQWTRELEDTERLLRRGELGLRFVDDDEPTRVRPTSAIARGASAEPADALEGPVTDVHFETPYADLSESLEVLTSADIEILDARPLETSESPVEPAAPPSPTPERLDVLDDATSLDTARPFDVAPPPPLDLAPPPRHPSETPAAGVAQITRRALAAGLDQDPEAPPDPELAEAPDAVEPSDPRNVEPSDPRTLEPSNGQTVEPSDPRTLAPSFEATRRVEVSFPSSDEPVVDGEAVLEAAPTEVRETENTPVDLVAPAPGQPLDVSGLARGETRKLEAGQRPTFHLVVDDSQLAAFGERDPEPFLQLHRLPTYPIVDVLLVASDDTGVPDQELFVTFDVRDEGDRHMLDRLATACTFEVHLYEEGGTRAWYQSFRLPLERNVEHLVAQAEAWLEEHADTPDLDAALEIFGSDGYERLVARKHNFHRNSFAEITSASAARLAVNIVGYWSEDQNFRTLVENRSFPLDHFRAIQDRVIHAAVRFGIFLPRELRERAVALQLADSQAALVDLLVERFYALTAEGGDTDLDAVVQAENWDQLLTASADLGGAVDPLVSEWAESVRRQAHRASSAPHRDPLDLVRTAEYARVTSLSDASNEDLQALLERGGVAAAVSRELVGRGGETNIFYVIESARALDQDSLLATARILAAGAAAFEPALLMGLGRLHPSTIHLCALALAMARRVEALPTLVELLHDPERSAGLPIRDILTEYGAEAIPALFEAIEERGATDDLVEVLAMISLDAGAEIVDALRHHPTAVLLEAAQRLSDVRRRLGGRRVTSLSERARALLGDLEDDPSDQGGSAG